MEDTTTVFIAEDSDYFLEDMIYHCRPDRSEKDTVYCYKNYNFVLARDLKTAERMLSTQRYDFFFLDNQINGEDSKELVQSYLIRKILESYDSPVIFDLSTHNNNDKEAEKIKAKCPKKFNKIIEALENGI